MDRDLSIIGRLGLFAIPVIGEHRVDHDRTISTRLTFHRTALRMRGRTPRSWLNRAAIAARSSRNRGAGVAKSSLVDRTAIDD